MNQDSNEKSRAFLIYEWNTHGNLPRATITSWCILIETRPETRKANKPLHQLPIAQESINKKDFRNLTRV